MGPLLLRGWRMLASSCPACGGVPLMAPPRAAAAAAGDAAAGAGAAGSGAAALCVLCDGWWTTPGLEPAAAPASGGSPAAAPAPPRAPAPPLAAHTRAWEDGEEDEEEEKEEEKEERAAARAAPPASTSSVPLRGAGAAGVQRAELGASWSATQPGGGGGGGGLLAQLARLEDQATRAGMAARVAREVAEATGEDGDWSSALAAVHAGAAVDAQLGPAARMLSPASASAASAAVPASNADRLELLRMQERRGEAVRARAHAAVTGAALEAADAMAAPAQAQAQAPAGGPATVLAAPDRWWEMSQEQLAAYAAAHGVRAAPPPPRSSSSSGGDNGLGESLEAMAARLAPAGVVVVRPAPFQVAEPSDAAVSRLAAGLLRADAEAAAAAPPAPAPAPAAPPASPPTLPPAASNHSQALAVLLAQLNTENAHALALATAADDGSSGAARAEQLAECAARIAKLAGAVSALRRLAD